MIGSELLRYRLDTQKVCVIDTETEGLALAYSRPWQVSYGIGTLRSLEAVSVRHVNWPGLDVSPEAAQVTRFNMADHLRIAEEPSTVVSDLDTYLFNPDYLIIWQNGLGFDAYILDILRQATGRAQDWSYMPRTLDTMCLSKAYRLSVAPSGDRLSWQYKLLHERLSKKKVEGDPKRGGGVNLGAMCKQFNIEYDPMRAHDASYDVSRTHLLLGQLIWQIEI